MYLLFQDLSSYSILDMSYQKYEDTSLEFLLSHFDTNHTDVYEEWVLSLQQTLQSLAAKVPEIILQRMEERFPALRESMASVVGKCPQIGILSSYSLDLDGQRN